MNSIPLNLNNDLRTYLQSQSDELTKARNELNALRKDLATYKIFIDKNLRKIDLQIQTKENA